MTKKKSSGDKLDRLSDELVRQILDAPASEISENDRDGKGAQSARAAFDAAKVIVAKQRLEDARAALASKKNDVVQLPPLSLEKKREMLAKFRERAQNNVPNELTLAARNAKELGERELDAAIESLIRLGLLGPDGEPR